MSHKGVNPELIKKSKKNLDKAYKRLVGFECSKEGYEWFGSNPGHEALTAYGLMQFMEMKNVMSVDEKMVERTKDWLINRKDGKGGYKRNSRALDSFGGAPEKTTDTYITWALIQSGQENMENEIDYLKKIAFESSDSYIIALAANTLYKAGEKNSALKLMRILKTKQDKDGHIQGAVTSITHSGGESLIIETTALAVLSWIYEEEFSGNVEMAIKYIVSKCQNGMFYSTQSTILALKAIILYDEYRPTLKRPGTFEVFVDGKAIGGQVDFNNKTKGVIELPDISYGFKSGSHIITIKMIGGGKIPFSSSFEMYTKLPISSNKSKVRLTTYLSDIKIKEGESTELFVKVENITKEAITTPIAIIGIPGGLDPVYNQLEELVKSNRIAAFEVKNQMLILYWRGIPAKKSIKIPINLIAGIPGKYHGASSRAYEYYTPEFKSWKKGVDIEITVN